MRHRFEFTFHALESDLSVDATLALLGSQGWEIRGVTERAGGPIVVALRRPLDEEHPLPERDALAATLEAPLVAPGADEFETV